MKQQDQSILSKYLPIQAGMFFFVLLLFAGCEHKISRNPNLHQKQDIIITDSIKTTLDFYYINFPDSAILLSEQLLLQIKKGTTAEDQLFLYSFLAELYQYRKKNDLLSLHNLTQVIRVLSEYPALTFDNPYLFVNFGNILLKYGLYKQALGIYREALHIPLFPDNHHIKILTRNNIALMYDELNRFDSARYYFQQAASYIPAKSYLLQAQNDAYLTTLHVENNCMDSVPVYYQKAVGALNKYKDYSLSQPKINYKADVLYHEIWSKIDKAKAVFFETSMQYDSSFQYLQTSLCHSKMAGTDPVQADIYFLAAQIAFQTKNCRLIRLYADSAMMLAKQFEDYDRMLVYSSFLSKYYDQQHNIFKQMEYQQLIIACEDTLMKQKTSKKLLFHKINMATGSMDLILRNMHITQQKHNETIGQQKTIIYISILLLMVISVFLLIYLYLYFKIKKTQLRLAHRTSELVQIENRLGNKSDNNNNNNNNVNLAYNNLVKRFEVLMEKEKPYLDLNLNLSILATKLQTNQTYISQLINKKYNVNYNEYINNKRIAEACSLFSKIHETNMTIDHVVSQVGFRSKSAFYNAFRKYSGVSPAMFIKIQAQRSASPSKDKAK